MWLMTVYCYGIDCEFTNTCIYTYQIHMIIKENYSNLHKVVVEMHHDRRADMTQSPRPLINKIIKNNKFQKLH